MQLLRSALGVVAGLIILSVVSPLSAVLTVVLVAIFAIDPAIDPATARDIEAGCTIIIFGIGAYAAYRAYKKIAGVRKAS